MAAPVPDAIKREISVRFVDELDRLGAGEKTLEEMLRLVDETQRVHPGDDRQSRFYNAVREMSRKISGNPMGDLDETRNRPS